MSKMKERSSLIAREIKEMMSCGVDPFNAIRIIADKYEVTHDEAERCYKDEYETDI